MTGSGFMLFDTAIGACGIAWCAAGIIGTSLPEGDAANLRARFQRRFAGIAEQPAPPDVTAAANRMAGLLAGGRDTLADIPLVLDAVPAFNRQVYALARAIAPGETTSYGALARALGDVAQARAVGVALGQNPFPVIVPCHRILAANGAPGGFSADGGVETKLRMLTAERARTSDLPLLFDSLPLAAAPGRKGH